MVKQIVQLSIAILLCLSYIIFVEHTAYTTSNIPVSGEIQKVWESKGRNSSTLMLTVKFDYGIETVNANGLQYKEFKKGDTYTNSCQYIPIVGCSGKAYTGYVDNFYGKYSLLFSLTNLLTIFLLCVFLLPALYTRLKGMEKGKFKVSYQPESDSAVMIPDGQIPSYTASLISHFEKHGFVNVAVSNKTLFDIIKLRVEQNNIPRSAIKLDRNGVPVNL